MSRLERREKKTFSRCSLFNHKKKKSTSVKYRIITNRNLSSRNVTNKTKKINSIQLQQQNINTQKKTYYETKTPQRNNK